MKCGNPFIAMGISSTIALFLAVAQAPAAEADGKAIYLSDLSKCEPATAISSRMEPSKWRLLTYKSPEVSGVMVKSPSFVDAPDLTLPLKLVGWHSIYVGYWNPMFDYDGDHLIKVKLSGEPAFRRIEEKNSSDSQVRTFLRESFVQDADLTGKNFVIGKCSGPGGRKASLAYVKLVPLSAQRVAEILRDRSRPDTKKLQVSFDGYSFAWGGEFAKVKDLLDLIEPYRHSDVERVLWAVCYGERTNYPTRVNGAAFLPAKDVTRAGLCRLPAHDYIRNEKNWGEAMRNLADHGTTSAQVVAEHLHSMGIKCDLTFRLGIISGMFGDPHDGLVIRHPECCQVDRQGNAVAKASYAFPRVQQLMLDIIREAMEMVDADGASLCFTRGPRFMLYEKPVLDSFQQEYGVDARTVPPSDLRLLKTRAKLMTRFVRGARNVLDEIGRKRGRKLQLSVWVWPHDQNTWCGLTPMDDGIDIETWVKKGLVNSIICKQDIDQQYLTLCKKHGCEYVACNEPQVWSKPQDVSKVSNAGVEKLMWWDADPISPDPARWEWFRRIGHTDEMKTWDPSAYQPRSIVLEQIGGINVSDSFLQQAVYSGG
jgi:hypothetical protein